MINHLGIIMDGNRRWAVQHSLEQSLGHKEGIKAVDAAVKFAIKNCIKYLTLYAFSIENLSRSELEKAFMFSLLVSESAKRIDEFKARDIQINFKGDRSLFPMEVINACEKIEKETACNKTLKINILFCYGGQQEIVCAAKKLAQQFKDGKITENQLEERFNQNLWCSNFPDPELILRSGGRARLSNFLTFKSAYRELTFTDILWPDITETYLQSCLDEYNSRQRNFGK